MTRSDAKSGLLKSLCVGGLLSLLGFNGWTAAGVADLRESVASVVAQLHSTPSITAVAVLSERVAAFETHRLTDADAMREVGQLRTEIASIRPTNAAILDRLSRVERSLDKLVALVVQHANEHGRNDR